MEMDADAAAPAVAPLQPSRNQNVPPRPSVAFLTPVQAHPTAVDHASLDGRLRMLDTKIALVLRTHLSANANITNEFHKTTTCLVHANKRIDELTVAMATVSAENDRLSRANEMATKIASDQADKMLQMEKRILSLEERVINASKQYGKGPEPDFGTPCGACTDFTCSICQRAVEQIVAEMGE
jgi:hypothetical protein